MGRNQFRYPRKGIELREAIVSEKGERGKSFKIPCPKSSSISFIQLSTVNHPLPLN
jgi:hypothetical protein